MKKNKMMRLASVLLVLTLLTTGIIGGTLAKYVTDGSGTDTARIAKFGVVAAVSGDLFGSTYAKKTTSGGNTIVSYSTSDVTVKANDKDTKVVAPGTENKEGLTFSVQGKPEVSTQVTLGNAKKDGKEYANSDIYLATGEYGVMVEYEGEQTAENITQYYTLTDGTYTQAEVGDVNEKVYELCDVATINAGDYHPLTWYVDGTFVDKQETINTTLAAKYTSGGTPDQEIDFSATVGWEWKFEDSVNDAERDAKDTILGDMIAAHLTAPAPIAVVAKSGDEYVTVTYKEEAIDDSANTVVNAYADTSKVACLTASFGASLTVEQVD